MPVASRLLGLTVLCLLVVLASSLAGCPPAQKSDAPCTKIGQTCTVAAGKLGTCVKKDDCTAPTGCFDCQSQH